MISNQMSLLSMGVASCTATMLGLSVYNLSKKDTFKKLFLFFCSVTTVWVISDYFTFTVSDVSYALIILRLHLFVTVWLLFLFFIFSLTIAEDTRDLSSRKKMLFLTLVASISFLTLTPVTFTGKILLHLSGQTIVPEPGYGIIIFVIYVASIALSSVGLLVLKIIKSSGAVRKKVAVVMVGMMATIMLLLASNLIMPVFFMNTLFMPFAPIFILPFLLSILIAASVYSLFDFQFILIHLTFIFLWSTVFAKLLISNSLDEVLEWSVFMFSVLVFGYSIVKNILQGVEQIEQINIVIVDMNKASEIINGLNVHFSQEENFFIGK